MEMVDCIKLFRFSNEREDRFMMINEEEEEEEEK